MDRIRQAEATGDVEAVMETKGVGKSQAYELTKETRKQEIADRDAEIHRRYDGGDGETQQGIADAFGIGLATVNRVLKKENSIFPITN